MMLVLVSTTVEAQPFAYITNQLDGTVSVIDTATNTVTATIPLGGAPLGVGVHPAGTLVYVGNASNSVLSVIDTATNTVTATVQLGGSSLGVAVHPAGTSVYVANMGNLTVSVIDTATNTVTTTGTVGGIPVGVAVHPTGASVYVTITTIDRVVVIDTATNTITTSLPVGMGPGGVAVHPAGTAVYVVNGGSSTVSVIDPATNTVTTTIPVGARPIGVAVHPAGTSVYVANFDGDSVSVIDTATNTVTATVPLGRGASPHGLAAHPAGTSVYVANAGSDNVSVIDTATNMVIATVPVGNLPRAFGQFITSDLDCDFAGLELALVLDGSDTVTEEEFDLQRIGLLGAVLNSDILPRDGSVAFTLVQYGNGMARVEVPYTIISSLNDANFISDQLLAMVQLGGARNPGDGINAAMEVLNTSGCSLAKQAICLSATGAPQAGADLAGVLAAAQSSPIGLDTFGVIAIERPGVFGETELLDTYGDLVFGGGGAAMAFGIVEFANAIGPACFGRPVKLVGLEVIQSVQDWQNSVVLIEDKTTFVRAHLEPIDGSVSQTVASARLRAFRGGVELLPPQIPINPAGRILVLQDAPSVRGDFDESLNFRLPKAWCSGTISLNLEGFGTQIDCTEAAATSDDCTLVATFVPSAAPDLKFIGFDWIDDDDTLHLVSDGDLDELRARLEAMFPVSNVNLSKQCVAWSGSIPPHRNDGSEILAKLKWHQRRDGCGFSCDTIYYGVVTDDESPDPLGVNPCACGFFSSGAENRAWGFLPPASDESGRHTHAHEIAHALRIEHAPDGCGAVPRDCPASPGQCWNDPLPYVIINGDAHLGPMGDPDTEIWGYDSHVGRVIDPNFTLELMGYCTSQESPWKWTSKLTYESLRDEINDRFGSSLLSAAGGSRSFLFARGIIDRSQGTVRFLPFAVIESDVPPVAPDPGEFSLRFEDAAGNVVAEIPFALELLFPDPVQGPPGPAQFGVFTVPVDADPAIRRAVLTSDGRALGEIAASPNAPAIELLFPGGGESLDGDEVLILWSADDADDDVLAFDVQYSADGGVNWQTIVVDWPFESFIVDLSQLPGSESSRVRVFASDGFNTAVDTSGTFSVADNPPSVIIRSPQAGDEFSGVQTISLSALALDVEDTDVQDAGVEWFSSVDGFLGTGRDLSVVTADLTPGQHTITVLATDSAGNTASNAVDIAVELIALEDGVTIPFVSLDADVEIELEDDEGEFKVEGSFTLSPASDGIDPLTEDVTLSVGTFTTTIPSGSFELTQSGPFGEFGFEGVIEGVELEFEIRIHQGNSFEFEAEGEGADLIGTTNPVEVTLVIANDRGTTVVTAPIEDDDSDSDSDSDD